MRFRALLVLLVLLVAAVAALLPVAAAGPAAAGGPTSVLMSSPVLGRTSSLYTADDGYQALADYVDAFEAGTGRAGEPTAHAIGNQITLTWLIHDVSVWRVDRIYPDAVGGPWIATQDVLGTGTDVWSAPVRWHRSDQSKALMGLLAAHGLTDGSELPAGSVGDVTAQQYVAPDPAAAGTDDTSSGTDAAGQSASAGQRTVVALLVGLLLGAGATGAAVTVLARRRASGGGDRADRGERTDGDAGAEPGWTAPDLLPSTRCGRGPAPRSWGIGVPGRGAARPQVRCRPGQCRRAPRGRRCPPAGPPRSSPGGRSGRRP